MHKAGITIPYIQLDVRIKIISYYPTNMLKNNLRVIKVYAHTFCHNIWYLDRCMHNYIKD